MNCWTNKHFLFENLTRRSYQIEKFSPDEDLPTDLKLEKQKRYKKEVEEEGRRGEEGRGGGRRGEGERGEGGEGRGEKTSLSFERAWQEGIPEEEKNKKKKKRKRRKEGEERRFIPTEVTVESPIMMLGRPLDIIHLEEHNGRHARRGALEMKERVGGLRWPCILLSSLFQLF